MIIASNGKQHRDEIEWSSDRCILCTHVKKLTLEHIFSKSIDGTLKCRYLCEICNNEKLGSDIEAGLLKDPSIQMAIDALARDVSAISSRLNRDRRITIHGPDGRQVAGRLKGGVVRADVRANNGSFVIPSSDTATIRGILTSLVDDPCEVERIARLSSEAPNTSIVESTGIRIERWDPVRITTDLHGPRISERFPLKVAYESLALIAGEAIFSDKFDSVRSFLLGETDDYDGCQIKHLFDPTGYRPIHRLAVEGTSGSVTVHISVFGWQCWRVHFPGVLIASPGFSYVLDLRTKIARIERIDSRSIEAA